MPEPVAIKNARLTAAILAGGAGSRVGGCDKGLMHLGGRPLIAHVAEAVARQAGRIIICARIGALEYAQFGPVAADQIGGYRGPLAGIAAALNACATEWLMTVPVDCPSPPSAAAARLLEAAILHKSSIAVAHDGRRRQPLFAVYRREMGEAAQRALAENLPVWQWQDAHGACEVDFSDCIAGFTNLNTIEDFERWETEHRV